MSVDDVFAYIHADNSDVISEAEERLINAYTISDERCEPEDIIKEIII